MRITTCRNGRILGHSAADMAVLAIREAVAARGLARIVVATGKSQFQVLESLVSDPGVEWSAVEGFHLDEYIGLPAGHPASFRKFLQERLVWRVALHEFHFIDGEADPLQECARVGGIIRQAPIDVALVGIGENGHLAFNDPPADFQTSEPYIVVDLDEACRRQQVGEGWFASLEEVPRRAISMSIRQIISSRLLLCSVPEKRKAQAVHLAMDGPVTPDVPASILQSHPNAMVFLDPDSSSLLTRGGKWEEGGRYRFPI